MQDLNKQGFKIQKCLIKPTDNGSRSILNKLAARHYEDPRWESSGGASRENISHSPLCTQREDKRQTFKNTTSRLTSEIQKERTEKYRAHVVAWGKGLSG